MDPCEQAPVILELQKAQLAQGAKLDSVLSHQKQLGTDLKQALDRLTSIIEEDIGTRKDVEQGKKDIERLYAKARETVDRVDAIEIRNAKCDGLGVFTKFPIVWDFFQQEKGWRRFFPALMAGLSFLALMWDKLPSIFGATP